MNVCDFTRRWDLLETLIMQLCKTLLKVGEAFSIPSCGFNFKKV